jgi:hypothetical protein
MSDPSLKAYQEFMLQGKRAGGGGNAPSTPTTPMSGGDPMSSGKKRNKSEMAVFRAFQGRLQEWKDLDNQLDAVLDSIVNLRDRIWWETKHLQELSSAKPWQKSCFRSTSRFATALKRDDVQVALTHDLLQHEKMLTSSRTLIASLAQAQDAMGRRLDEWMMMDLEDPLSEQGQATLEQAQGVYVFLAEELYRKQLLVKRVLDSCHDGLVDEDALEEVIGNPRAVTRQTCAAWASKDSEMISMMARMLQE